jgi:hypothetical protein
VIFAIETHMQGMREVPPWVSIGNGVDFQHLRTKARLDEVSIEFRKSGRREVRDGARK